MTLDTLIHVDHADYDPINGLIVTFFARHDRLEF